MMNLFFSEENGAPYFEIKKSHMIFHKTWKKFYLLKLESYMSNLDVKNIHVFSRYTG